MNANTAARAIALQNAAANWAATARAAYDRITRIPGLTTEQVEHLLDYTLRAQANAVTPAAIARSIITD